MDALKFVNGFARMCNKSRDDCSNCPLDKIGCAITIMDDEGRKNMVEAVEKWIMDHPKKTRQSEFLKHYPNAVLIGSDVLRISPCEMEKSYYEATCSGDCFRCREEYWLQEVE